MTLAPDAFSQEGYFEVYVKYVEERRQAQAEGRNLDLVAFNLPMTDEDDPSDEETMPLDSEDTTPNDEGDEATTHEDSESDQDSDI